ncbi:MAG: hypothetical protein LWW85_10140, partial [Marinilabiliales bacterium]|nr:hypothetical protein [Marinilabiliales bacterium]
PSLPVISTRNLDLYATWFQWMQKYGRVAKVYRILLYFLGRMGGYLSLLKSATSDKNIRKDLFNRLTHPSWYLQHIQSYKKHLYPDFRE